MFLIRIQLFFCGFLFCFVLFVVVLFCFWQKSDLKTHENVWTQKCKIVFFKKDKEVGLILVYLKLITKL